MRRREVEWAGGFSLQDWNPASRRAGGDVQAFKRKKMENHPIKNSGHGPLELDKSIEPLVKCKEPIPPEGGVKFPDQLELFPGLFPGEPIAGKEKGLGPALENPEDEGSKGTSHAYPSDQEGEKKVGQLTKNPYFIKPTYSIAEAAVFVGLSQSSIRRAVKSGDIIAIRLTRHILIPYSEIQRFLRVRD